MEDADMLVAVTGEQARYFGVGSGCIADRDAMLGRHDVADARDDALRSLNMSRDPPMKIIAIEALLSLSNSSAPS
ncbi:hypothetical protein SAMN05518861_11669 [Mesorhizobium sp. YR577]|nr:hypothetical protein SAMN05518861_11669 [Mesorhizobium sp. YR577]